MKAFEFFGDKRTCICKILYKWGSLLKKYEKTMSSDDLPYFYIERTNIGLLSSAALNSGYFPLEEYSTEKGKEAKKRIGRADLRIFKNSGESIDFEAKQIWIGMRNKEKDIKERIKEELSDSLKDVGDIKDKADTQVGIVFAVPYTSTNHEINKKYLKNFRKAVSDISNIDKHFAAIHFCEERYYEKAVYNENIYLGIAIVGKYTQYPKKTGE